MQNTLQHKNASARIFWYFLVLLILTSEAGCGGSMPYFVAKPPDLKARKMSLKKEISTRQAPVPEIKKGELLKRYQGFLEKHQDDKSGLRVPALKRLGDLYMAQARLEFIQEMEAYEINPHGPPPLVNYKKAMAPYRELLHNYPDYPENDQVLYALSRAYAETGERDRALPLLEGLVKKYPDSPYRLEAYFRLGEYYFDRRAYEQAASAYGHAASWEDPFFQDKARYKLGWTYFKLKKYPEAVHQFLTVIDQKTAGMAVFSPQEGSLVWEALSYVATSFRNLGGASAASDYFLKNGARSYENNLYLMMGNHYMVEGSVQRGIETYRAFIDSHPMDAMNPFFTAYVIEGLQKLGDRDEAKAVRIALVQRYASKSPWYENNDADARVRSRPLIKSELNRLALVAHTRAQKGQESDDYQEAARWYRKFLSEFPDEEKSQEIRFLLGETLMSLHSYADAGAAYKIAAYGERGEKPNRKAAYAAVVAYEKVKTPSGEAAFVSLSNRFVNVFSKDPQAPTVLFNAAEFLFAKGRYHAASALLEKLLRKYPKHTTVTMARKLSGHSYMKEGKFSKARRAYRDALSHLPEAKKETRRELNNLLATAIYKAAESQREKGELLSAANLFQGISREVPKSDLAPGALFEAGLLYEKLNQPETALQVYRKLAQKNEASLLSGEAALHAGLLYEKLGKGLQAAEMFVLAAKKTKDSVQGQKLLWRAGLHYEKLARWNKVVSTFLIFTRRYPGHADTQEAFFRMAEARQKQGRVAAAEKLYQAVITSGKGSVFSAKARFWQAERSFVHFKSIRLKAPLAKSLKRKTKALKQVLDLYAKGVKTGHSDIVAASAYRLGQVFEHFKTALLHAEQPKKLSEDQLEEYQFQLEEKAYPFEAKAITAYESNVRRVQKSVGLYSVGLYNDWIRKSYDRLAELRPLLYRRKERSERIVSNIDLKSLPKILFSESSKKALVQVR